MGQIPQGLWSHREIDSNGNGIMYMLCYIRRWMFPHRNIRIYVDFDVFWWENTEEIYK
jgi:hypothetical protein